jgi:hypothetical protein
MKLDGQRKRTERAVDLYLRMWRDYNDPLQPLTVNEIIDKYRKKDGTTYSRSAIYRGFMKLEELKLV